MGYDRGESFPYDFEPNRIPFGSRSIGKDRFGSRIDTLAGPNLVLIPRKVYAL